MKYRRMDRLATHAIGVQPMRMQVKYRDWSDRIAERTVQAGLLCRKRRMMWHGLP